MIVTINRQHTATLVTQAKQLLGEQTREQLRGQARMLGVRRGRSKLDTINNLIDAGHVRLVIETI